MPVRLADGRVTDLGLLGVFRRSGEIVALAETAPPSLVAQYRLLLAITHRALTGTFRGEAAQKWSDRDRATWYRTGLPVERICEYLEHWRDRFWLFHPAHPFMQVAELATADETRDKEPKPWTQISLASASGNAPVVFDHSHDDMSSCITPAQAVRALLGYLQFTPGGLVKMLRASDKAGALANTAAVIPMGSTLAQTLCLCLHPAPSANGVEDVSAWEREPLMVAQICADPVLATGPNDRYTRQSRAVLLQPEEAGEVCRLRFAAGFALGEDANAPDPMASFRAGTNGLVRLTFTEGRALWRDLPAIVPNPSGSETQPAAVLNHAIALHAEDSFDRVHQPLLVAGVASDQAKLLRWRSELLVLPVSLLADAEKVQYLRQLVAQVDDLFWRLRKMAVEMMADVLPDPNSKDTRNHARSLLEAGPFTVSYFAAAERALPRAMKLLAGDQPEEAATLWNETLRNSALKSWQQVLAGMGKSARALRSDAKYWPKLHGLLNEYFSKEKLPVTAET